MRWTLIAFSLVGMLNARAADDEFLACLALKGDKPRLACFDKAAKAAAEAKVRLEAERQKADAERALKPVDANLLTPEQLEAAKAAVRQLNKLSSATEVGISYRDYGTRIVDVSGEFKEAARKLPDSDLQKALNAALADHVRAREVWSALIQASYGEVFEKVMCPSLASDYPGLVCRAETNYRGSGRTQIASISDSSKAQILNHIWSVARDRAKKAEELIEKGRMNEGAK